MMSSESGSTLSVTSDSSSTYETGSSSSSVIVVDRGEYDKYDKHDKHDKPKIKKQPLTGSLRPPSTDLEKNKPDSKPKRNKRLNVKTMILIGSVLIAGLIVMVVTLPMSFTYIRYDEMAFKKNTLTNKVDTSQIWGPGRYFWGPSYTKLAFDSQYQRIQFVNDTLRVFSLNGLDFPINLDIYYRLGQDNLTKIFSDVGIAYEDRLKALAEASLKNTATQFTVDQYINERVRITGILWEQLNVDLEEIHIQIDQDKLLLKSISFPNDVSDVFLNTAVQELENEKAILDQTVELTQLETDQLIAQINANITIINGSTEALVDSIVAVAEAQADGIVQGAIGEGINYMFMALNVTQPEERALIFNLLGVWDNSAGVKLVHGNMNAFINV